MKSLIITAFLIVTYAKVEEIPKCGDTKKSVKTAIFTDSSL